MSVNAALAKPGCGCGGNGGCGCGGSGGTATANLAATAFVRPTFFAGQLLTEDDLSALTAYVTAKDRLHNRYLFGGGVVCGLWVNCDPCGGGTVTVQPGYALDCCGNDLILPCAVTLDVNAMIRDLRAAQLGQDCGDPCAGQGTAPASPGHQKPAATRHYRLYARYGEQATDPVAPYSTGEACGQVACEPTRIREGISFVLKCPGDTPAPDDLWCRLRKCLASEDILRREARLKAYSEPMIAAARAAEHPPAFDREAADELRVLRPELAKTPSAVDEEQVRSAIEHVRQAAAVIAGYDLAHDRPDLPGLAEARAELRDAAAALAARVDAARYDPLDRPAVDALLGQAQELAGPSVTLSRVRLAMLAQGQPLDDEVLAGLTSDAATLREWLLDRLDNDPALADCQLRSQARALSLTAAAEGETSELRVLGRAGSELAELIAGVLTDCICAALNPPCVSCEDTDVLLACLEVGDCTVVRICNAGRDYVISGSALRYWLPTGPLHEAVESFCCRAECGRDVARAEPGRLACAEAGFGTGGGTVWDLLSVPHPGHLLRDAMERAGAARAAPAVPQPPPAASGAAADTTAQQIAALAGRVAELTERLTQTRARLDETEASLGTLSSQPPARMVRAAPSQATARRSPAPRRPAAAKPAAAKPGGKPADAGTSPADSGTGGTGSGAPEASDDT